MSAKNKTGYMSYDSYKFISDLIDGEMVTLENNLRRAYTFISLENKKASEEAHAIFIQRLMQLKSIKKEFSTLVKSSYKKHPNKKLREFWTQHEPI